ncbi:hypothetical protein MTP99_019348 [Tenebrio molitor]|nr:hypothetical protein MTP99_019348 [Tenebrio molitor]
MPWPECSESQNNINKPSLVTNTSNLNSWSSTPFLGEPATNASTCPSVQTANIFESPLTSSFSSGNYTQSIFGSNLSGQPQSANLSFGSTNIFDQNKTMFGFGFTPSQTGLLDEQLQEQIGTSLSQSNTNTLFGNQIIGTVIKFSPVTGTDTLQKNRVPQSISISTKHHCITCMKEYENKSLEELRFEDYTCNRKGPRVQPGCGATPFGTPTSSTPHYFLFEQTDNKTGFGQPQDFGQTPSFGPSTVVFGVSNQTNTFKLNPPSTSNPFSANQTQKTFSQPLFGTTTTQPAFGTGIFEQTNTQNTTTNLFQKTAQTTNGFNTGQPSFSFNQIDTTQASNLFQVSRPNGFGVAPFGTSTSSTSTPGVGQFTLAFGVPNQTNTSSLFSKPSIFESESFIMSELEKRQSEAVGKLKVVEKQRNEMEELLIKIEETKRECKLKEEVHTMLTGKWNVKRSKFDTQIEKLNKKILTLETIIESKEKLIERLVSYFKEERESVSKANLRIGELVNWKINKLKDELSRNNANLDNDADTGTNVLAEIEQFEEKVNPILKLESNLNEEKQKYLDLTVRYEILEEEHVITKAKLVMEKETIENQLSNTKSEFQELNDELKALRKTYNEQHELDQIRLQSLLEGKLSEIDQLKKENEVINDQLEQMRKESDELKKKLDGYEKVNNLTGNINMDTSARDNEIMQLEAKPSSIAIEEPKTRKLEECKKNTLTEKS